MNPTASQLVDQHMTANQLIRNHTDWTSVHAQAFVVPVSKGERAMVNMVRMLAALVDASGTHDDDVKIGEDGYFHEHALDMFQAALAYLNFDMGRLDCGSLDRLIREIAKLGAVEIPE
jgi:hypothetical protein